jgi:hypothetical protein
MSRFDPFSVIEGQRLLIDLQRMTISAEAA